MLRHLRLRCKASDRAKEENSPPDVVKKVERLEAELAELKAMMKKGAEPFGGAHDGVPAARVNGVQQVAVSAPIVNNIHLNVRPWDCAERISVPVDLIAAAFAENPRLAEYARMGDEEKTNPELAGPFVLEALMDLTRRAHKDPVTRNVYLNPRRADQVLVCLKDGTWEVRPLEDFILIKS